MLFYGTMASETCDWLNVYFIYLNALSEVTSLENKHGTFLPPFMSVFLLQCGTDYQPAKQRHKVTPTHIQFLHQHLGSKTIQEESANIPRQHRSLLLTAWELSLKL